ncbi:MAG: hypothetical protein Kow00121_34240 [Elainellaceae cyanobacterium]
MINNRWLRVPKSAIAPNIGDSTPDMINANELNAAQYTSHWEVPPQAT